MEKILRRDLLRGALGASALALPAGVASSLGAETSARESQTRDTVRDRLWIFTTVAGGDNTSLQSGGVSVPSRMTPAEGAFYLDVPNLLMIRWRGLPPFDQCKQYALTYRPLKRVIWSIVGSGGRMDGDELPRVLELAAEFPNITGVFLDDFFVSDKKGGSKKTGAFSPEELGRLRNRLVVSGRRLETWVTFYSRVFDPSHPNHFQVDLPLAKYLDHFDVITLWTRGGNRLENLQDYFEKLEEASPAPAKALGCDFWDFLNKAPVPIRLMEHQCKLGLKWLREGRIREMIFLANTVMDVGLDVVEWTRQWIQEVGQEKLA